MSQPDGALDDFYDAYVEAALWSTNDESTPEGGVPFDQNYGPDDIHPDSREKMLKDCQRFLYKNRAHIKPEHCTRGTGEYSVYAQAGHDFWLTRCHHGAGFWDGDWTEPHAAKLTESAHSFGECDLVLGDDGKIHAT